jgi:hypothetical protein
MKIIVKEELKQVIHQMIDRESQMGLPPHESHEVIDFTIDDLIEEKPALLGFGTEREIKDYCHEIFDTVLEEWENNE